MSFGIASTGQLEKFLSSINILRRIFCCFHTRSRVTIHVLHVIENSLICFAFFKKEFNYMFVLQFPQIQLFTWHSNQSIEHWIFSIWIINERNGFQILLSPIKINKVFPGLNICFKVRNFYELPAYVH